MMLRTWQGKTVYLGEQTGKGGEATIYRVRGQAEMVAKIYDRGPRPEYPAKLLWMLNHPPNNPTRDLHHASLAWPQDLLFDDHRRLAGYVMPFIQGAVPILKILNPRLRNAVLPQFDRRYLHRVARNLAAAMSAVHQCGYVIGDLNESNVLVTPSALVTIIDTDSFQVTEEHRGRKVVHTCPVGKPDYTPPELQGKSFEKTTRTPEQDLFALAVLIFQLLMDGSHPFRAQWLGRGDPPSLEIRIARGAFPYTASPPLPVAPPNRAPGLDRLHPYLAELMVRCFVDGHKNPTARPTPAQWERAVALAESALIACSQGHYYSSHLPECPDCSAGRGPVHEQQPASARPETKSQEHRATAGRSTHQQPRQPPNAGPQTTGSVQGQAGQQRIRRNPVVRSLWPHPGTAAIRLAAARVFKTYYQPAAPSTPQAYTGRPAALQWFQWWQPAAAGQSSGARGQGSSPGSTGAAAAAWGAPSITVPVNFQQWKAGFWARTRQRFLESVLYGSGTGALAGAAAAGLVAAGAGGLGLDVSWAALLIIAGAVGGLLRGLRPGYRFGLWVNRYIGWHNFWQATGALAGALLGFLISVPFLFLILPALIGTAVGARLGFLAGRKIWIKGSPVGWERIWAGLSAVWLAFAGGLLLYWIGDSALFLYLAGNASDLGSWVLTQTGSQPLFWIANGILAGLIGGGTSGWITDFSARILGLLD
jgi:serine/threonine protein kinase